MHPLVLRTVAAGGVHPLIDIDGTIFIQLGLFLLMALVATQLLFKPYLKMREERTAGIEGARREAKELENEAETRMGDYEQRLARARDSALDEQRKVRAVAAAHQREVTDKAREQAAVALAEAHAKVVDETSRARQDLLPRADALARDIVVKLLGREAA
jgi:F-type H+-transporting ATPase subunit b